MSQLEKNGSSTNSQTINLRRLIMEYNSQINHNENRQNIDNYFNSQVQEHELILQCLQTLMNERDRNNQ